MRNLKRLYRKLRNSTSGNATLIVALGMPALIGGAGYAVDTAQWYMWEREMQYAVDQAAIVGAWTRADPDHADEYAQRAAREYVANLQKTDGYATAPQIALANYAGGSNNSVAVSATITRKLPFSSFITGKAATIRVYAQATFQEGATYTSCLVATDKDDEGAITIGGATIITASCGMAALSTDDNAIRVNGNPTVRAGYIIAAGGIDDWFDSNSDDLILENVSGLKDPFEDVEPPFPAESLVSRSYACTGKGKNKTASLLPGTYSGIPIACNTTFSTGVYIIDGGGLIINGNDEVTGSNVMFVLKNGAYIQLNGGADINLTAIQASDLIARGIAPDEAAKLAGMLVFEDREGSGTSGNRINGNAATVLNGFMYFPKSNVDFSGTASVTSQCLMVVAKTLNFTGTSDMSTFCPPGEEIDKEVAVTKPRVRLVA